MTPTKFIESLAKIGIRATVERKVDPHLAGYVPKYSHHYLIRLNKSVGGLKRFAFLVFENDKNIGNIFARYFEYLRNSKK